MLIKNKIAVDSSVTLDALDLFMTALREHEKKLDQAIEQLTLLAKSMENNILHCFSMRFHEETDSIQHEKLSRKLVIKLDVDLLQNAHELGVNVSDLFENALRESVAQRTR